MGFFSRARKQGTPTVALEALLGARLSIHTSGSRCDVASGSFGGLSSLGRTKRLVAAGASTIAVKVMTLNGTTSRIDPAAVVTQTATLAMDYAMDLPAASGSGVNGGFTCTGLTVWPAVPGGVIIGNDGRAVSGDASTNLTASIVFAKVDLVAREVKILDEILMTSLPEITVIGSIQGVIYLPALGLVAFAHQGMNQVYFLDPVARKIVATLPGGPYATLNGLGYDAETDCMILNDVNTTATWRDRATGTLVRTITLTASAQTGTTDHNFYDPVRGELFYTGGGNLFTGHLRSRRVGAVAVPDVFDFALTGADCIEGVVVLDNPNGTKTALITNDANYHGGASLKGQILVYTLPPLQKAAKWPIGREVCLWGNYRIPVAPSSTSRVVVCVGDPLVTGGFGVGVIAPSATLTQFRVIINNTITVNWTVAALSTAITWFARVAPLLGLAELFINGVSQGVQTFTAIAQFWSDPSPPSIGSDYGAATRWFPGEISAIGAGVDCFDSRAAIEAIIAADIA